MDAEAARAATALNRQQPLAARTVTALETKGLPSGHTTVDRTARGRSTLVNEMGGSTYRRAERGGLP
jgi:hypothetical protein